MKINRLETHDRLKQFSSQWESLSQGCIDCLNNLPDAIKFPVYIFAHPRSVDFDEQFNLVLNGHFLPEKAPTTRLIWVPRVTKPKAQTNSYLFLGQKGSEFIKVIWLLPPRETWKQYAPGQMTHNADVWTSIMNFTKARKKLEEPDADAPNENQINEFRRIIGAEAARKKKIKDVLSGESK